VGNPIPGSSSLRSFELIVNHISARRTFIGRHMVCTNWPSFNLRVCRLGMGSPKSFTYCSKKTFAVVILFFPLRRCLLPCTDPQRAEFQISVITPVNRLFEYPIARAKQALQTLFPCILVTLVALSLVIKLRKVSINHVVLFS
jgi:hypothetical protein